MKIWDKTRTYLLPLHNANFSKMLHIVSRIRQPRNEREEVERPRNLPGTYGKAQKFRNRLDRWMHTARFELAVAFTESDLSHNIEGHVVAPVVNGDWLSMKLGDFLDEERRDAT